jgi:hypothetical protein
LKGYRAQRITLNKTTWRERTEDDYGPYDESTKHRDRRVTRQETGETRPGGRL